MPTIVGAALPLRFACHQERLYGEPVPGDAHLLQAHEAVEGAVLQDQFPVAPDFYITLRMFTE
jgi:hypothetical protein